MCVHQTIIVENPSGEPSIGVEESTKPELNDFLMNKIFLLEEKSKTIRSICITEMVANIVFVFYGPLYILLLFYFISCIGYIGARDFKITLVYIYTFYQFFALCGKMYLVVHAFGDIENSLYVILCIAEIIQIIFFIYNLNFLKIMIHVKNNVLE